MRKKPWNEDSCEGKGIKNTKLDSRLFNRKRLGLFFFFSLFTSPFTSQSSMLTANFEEEKTTKEVIPEKVLVEKEFLLEEFHSANNKNARLARYYRLSSSGSLASSRLLDDIEPQQITSLNTYTNSKSKSKQSKTEMKRTSSDHQLLKSFNGNSASPFLKEQAHEEQEQSFSRTTKTVTPSTDITIEYEYPQLVASLKQTYREMGITGLLYLINISSAVGIVLVNKFIYNHFKFQHGLVLTFYHFLLTSLGLHILAAFKFFPVKPVKLIKILPLSGSFCSYVVLTNLSLQYNSGTFYQILVAPTIAVLQFLLYGIKTDLSLIPPMSVMLIGVAIATITELKTSVLGLSIAFSGIIMTAIYQIMVGAKQKQLGLSAIQLLYYQAPLSSLLLLFAIPFLTDIRSVLNFPYSRELVMAIFTSAFCAFLLNLSMYLVLGRSEPLTYNVVGLSKLFLVLSLNYWLFEISSSPNTLNLIGVLIAFMGVCSFSYVKFKSAISTNNKIS